MSLCGACGNELPGEATGGFCAQCVLSNMLMESDGGEDASDEGEGLIGATFGDYEIVEEIGRGGMGVVFKARQAGLNRIVALKLMQGGILASKKAMMRFQREASAVAKLDHPNVVPIYEIGQQAGHSFFSMRYVEGATLGDLIDNYSGNQERIARLLVKVARAIQFAHDRGVLHRDIKPQNILVDSEGEPFITDFGLAKIDDDVQMTGTGDVFGTPSFMAPEQVEGLHEAIDQRTDVYALGAVLYQLLTGRPPFCGETSF
jgi:eukaryotic-like serine/threonine-protein kinase